MPPCEHSAGRKAGHGPAATPAQGRGAPPAAPHPLRGPRPPGSCALAGRRLPGASKDPPHRPLWARGARSNHVKTRPGSGWQAGTHLSRRRRARHHAVPAGPCAAAGGFPATRRRGRTRTRSPNTRQPDAPHFRRRKSRPPLSPAPEIHCTQAPQEVPPPPQASTAGSPAPRRKSHAPPVRAGGPKGVAEMAEAWCRCSTPRPPGPRPARSATIWRRRGGPSGGGGAEGPRILTAAGWKNYRVRRRPRLYEQPAGCLKP
ncbi:ycf66-like protein [Balaenoptera musculus]|uniref:Ycf66-like protein n=1 Tax=Balaenoptera musculus TaxID=9771 RepID=A0A8B8WKU7_BALMU|nr:ycf66-like protein [Balaenoptera musculus]